MSNAAPGDSPPPIESLFLRRLASATLGLLLVVLAIHLLQEFRSILQPLFIAVFLSYVVLGAHRYVVSKGIPSLAAYIVLLILFLAALLGLGLLVYGNLQRLVDRLPAYKETLDGMIDEVLWRIGLDEAQRAEILGSLPWYQPTTSQQAIAQIRAWLGTFLNFFGALAITAVYLVFVAAERATFSRRILRAFAADNADRVLRVVNTINAAIGEYLAVKTFVSFLGGVFTTAILAAFGLDFYVTWGILTFVLNYIPYLGSLVATVLPIGLALVQLGFWQALAIAILLIAVQQALGVVIEPRIAGTRLNVSPLLILLALSFWGVVWGVVGMILAVPLLVSLKIILENIEATRPLAALMANVETPQG